MKTALITHADCLGHLTPDGHPERVARLEHILHALEPLDLIRVTAPLAADDDILRVHPESYLQSLAQSLPASGFFQIDADTWMSPGSLDAAFRAAGAVVKAVDMVLSGEAANAFAAVRPPGHHAEAANRHGVLPLRQRRAGGQTCAGSSWADRVAVVDFDVHHGNGTQDLLWDEPRALFISSHQMPLWPGSGRPDETGAYDNVLNIPLPPHSGGEKMRIAYKRQVFARLRAFKPELIIISAGFDAHQDDPLAELMWETEDFAWITAETVQTCRRALRGARGLDSRRRL